MTDFALVMAGAAMVLLGEWVGKRFARWADGRNESWCRTPHARRPPPDFKFTVPPAPKEPGRVVVVVDSGYIARIDAIEARLARLEPPADVASRLDEVQAQIKRVVDENRTEF